MANAANGLLDMVTPVYGLKAGFGKPAYRPIVRPATKIQHPEQSELIKERTPEIGRNR
jgi:hypothetical protein